MKMDIDEKNIIAALRSSPALKAGLLEMIDITDGESFEELDLGDDAEEAVVEVTQKTTHTLLQGWAEKKGKKLKKKQEKMPFIVLMKKKIKWQTFIGKIELEEQCFLHRKKRGVNKQTLAPLLRKQAFQIVRSRATKQMKAVSSPAYRDHLLKNCF